MPFRSSRLSTTSRLRLLGNLPLFAGLDSAALHRIDALTCPVQVPAGRVLTRQGCSGREAFVVVSGTADVAVDGRTVARLGPGQVIGELSLLDGAPRTATVSSLTAMELLVLDRAQFADLLRDDRMAERIGAVAGLRRPARAR